MQIRSPKHSNLDMHNTWEMTLRNISFGYSPTSIPIAPYVPTMTGSHGLTQYSHVPINSLYDKELPSTTKLCTLLPKHHRPINASDSSHLQMQMLLQIAKLNNTIGVTPVHLHQQTMPMYGQTKLRHPMPHHSPQPKSLLDYTILYKHNPSYKIYILS